MLEKVKAYISKNQLSAEDGDSLWCVIDVDRWPQKQIEELHAFCAQKDNWHLVISNPSIEIWLLYHKRTDLSGLGIQTANDAKQALDKIEKGGYYYIKYLPLMLDAIENARAHQKEGNYVLGANGYKYKTKKLRGEIIGEAWVVSVTKIFDEVWDEGEFDG